MKSHMASRKSSGRPLLPRFCCHQSDASQRGERTFRKSLEFVFSPCQRTGCVRVANRFPSDWCIYVIITDWESIYIVAFCTMAQRPARWLGADWLLVSVFFFCRNHFILPRCASVSEFLRARFCIGQARVSILLRFFLVGDFFDEV